MRKSLSTPLLCAAFLGFITASLSFGQAERKPLLLQSPTVSKTQIAFAYGGSIWIVGRDGGEAQRLVTGTGLLSGPIFSPDGSMVAYTGNYDGNVDVYVVPASGGEPRRLTYHPDSDVALGWTPDGKSVVFRSTRSSYSRFEKLFTVSLEGSFPTELPLPMGVQTSFSPDGARLAYVPYWNRRLFAVDNYIAIKHYRGGKTSPIWIANLADSSIEKIPRENSNDFNPMWVGEKIYFLSDRNGPVRLFAYDTRSKAVTEVVHQNGLDLKSASAGPEAIAYEEFGSLHLYDLRSGQTRTIHVTVQGDMPQVRPHFEKVEKQIRNAGISPTGARAVFEAHGEILTVPAEKGDIRNITRSPAVADRDPVWSPDGRSIAYFSDESGEYALHVSDQNGMGTVKKIDPGQPPSFFYSPTWSPDSKIAYTDKRLNLWYVDLDHRTPVKVDTDLFDTPLHEFDVAWSPDNKWLTYTKQLENHLRAVFVYSVDNSKASQVTDGMSDALYPNFDRNGKYLYFTASTYMGLTSGWLDMTSIGHPVTRNVYVAVLAKDLLSPIAPESDEEKASAEKEKKEGDSSAAASDTDKEKSKDKDKKEEKKEPVKVAIDFENLSQRILALPIPARNYQGLAAGKEGTLYITEGPQVESDTGPPALTLQRFDLKTRKTEKLLDGISASRFQTTAKRCFTSKATIGSSPPQTSLPRGVKGN